MANGNPGQKATPPRASAAADETPPTATAEVHVSRSTPVEGIFRRLFRRARKMVAAFRDNVTQMSRDVVNAIRRGFRRFAGTTGGKLILSGVGMIYTAQLAIGAGRFLTYSVGYGAGYILSQVVAVAFLVLGAAWFLAFGAQFLTALGPRPLVTTRAAA